MAADPEAGLAVPLKEVLEELCCPICYESVREGVESGCGHLFCRACLAECLNRKPLCPVCNAPCRPADPRPSALATRLLRRLQELKEGALAARLDRLASPAPERPVEAAVRKALAGALAAYEACWADLQARSRARVARGGDAGVEAAALARQEAALAAQYTAHFAALAPPPNTLPLLLDVAFASRPQLRLPPLCLQPWETVAEVREGVAAALAALGDPLDTWLPQNVWRLEERPGDEAGPLLRDGVPLSAFHPAPGARLLLLGPLRTVSSRPPECFKAAWARREREGKPATLVEDYYTCNNCRLNWVCAACAKECHGRVGHAVQEALRAHTPTWGCCYCAKSGLCRLHPAQ